MIELIERLDAASELLGVALEGYVEACFAIQTYYKQPIFTSVPQLLPDRITNELLCVTNYETNIKRAKSLISQARNCSSTTTSIHSLPSECLIRIFEFVVDARPCGVEASDNSGDKTSLPRYPDFLSHVCSRWRQIVIGLPSLWSHVDIVHLHSLSQGWVDRAEVCAARASHLPLDIHIQIPAYHNVDDSMSLFDFLESSASRARSLELAIPSTTHDFVYNGDVLECFFESCTPGTLVQLTVVDSGGYAPCFVVATDAFGDAIERRISRLFVSHQELEDTLLHVTSLQLEGIFFRWSSQAYHRLVELRLTTKNTRGITESITQSELNHILIHSPGLRILEIGLGIVYPPSESPNINNIQPLLLRDLEVLSLAKLEEASLGLLLSLLAPTLRPVRISIKYDLPQSPTLYDEAVLEFITRSNIAMLCVKNVISQQRLEELLTFLPNVQVLVLDKFYHRDIGLPPDDTVLPLPLRQLYLLKSKLDLDMLRKTLEKRPVRELIFWRSHVYVARLDNYLFEDQVRTELSNVCPIVKYIPSESPCPIDCYY